MIAQLQTIGCSYKDVFSYRDKEWLSGKSTAEKLKVKKLSLLGRDENKGRRYRANKDIAKGAYQQFRSHIYMGRARPKENGFQVHFTLNILRLPDGLLLKVSGAN